MRCATTRLVTVVLSSLFAACASMPVAKPEVPTPHPPETSDVPDVLTPPVAKKLPVTRTLHGESFVDDKAVRGHGAGIVSHDANLG